MWLAVIPAILSTPVIGIMQNAGLQAPIYLASGSMATLSETLSSERSSRLISLTM